MKQLTLPDLARLRLHAELAYARHGASLPMALLAALLCIGIWTVWVPLQAEKLNRASAQLARARQEISQDTTLRPQEPPLQAFRKQLRAQAETTAQLRQILQRANDAGVMVAQVDMRRQADAANAYSQLQIVLPVKGSYPHIRQLCLDLLQSMPSLSIDQLVLKHEQGAEVEAQLSLSLWQAPAAGGRP